MKDVYQMLEEEHGQMLNSFVGMIDANHKDGVGLDQLRTMFTHHRRVEEESFYPQLEQDPQLRPLVLQAIIEHQGADQLFQAADWMSLDDELWIARLSVLGDMVRAHIQKEQSQLFEGARRIMSDQQARDLANQLQQPRAA